MARNMLRNMSAPPRSEVRIRQNLPGMFIFFSPKRLASLLGCPSEELPERCAEYVAAHPEIADNPQRPRSYMVAQTTPQKRSVECFRLELLLVIFGSTLGDLYIPGRKLEYPKSRFDHTLYFRRQEVYGDDR